MAKNKVDGDLSLLGNSILRAIYLMRANEAEKVEVPPDVLAQGSEAQSPAEDAPTEPTPKDRTAGKGKSGNNPSPRKKNRQAPSA